MASALDLYYSCRLRRNLAESSERVPLGAAHYSYSAVTDKLVSVFRLSGYMPYELERPEIYPCPPLSSTRPSVHISFKPYEEIRLLNGAVNVSHVAWEFDRLPTRKDWPIGDSRNGHPFADYVHMLSLPDRIWVGSTFTKNVFNGLGFENVDLVPAPVQSFLTPSDDVIHAREVGQQIARRKLNRVSAIRLNRRAALNPNFALSPDNSIELSSILRSSDKIFLFVANPCDLRKNLPALLDGFSLAAQGGSSIALILKLAIDNKFMTLHEVLSRVLPENYSAYGLTYGDVFFTSIFAITEYLSDELMQALYLCADYYVTPAVAEGQNLPLQEAMAFGAIPVAARHTAMSDYVTEDNGVIIAHEEIDAPYCFNRAYGLKNLRIPHIDSQAVATAISSAVDMTDETLRKKRQLSCRTIAEGYSDQVVSESVKGLLSKLIP